MRTIKIFLASSDELKEDRYILLATWYAAWTGFTRNAASGWNSLNGKTMMPPLTYSPA